MPVEWNTNIGPVLARAKADDRSVLIDISGAPACVGSSSLDTESYGNEELSDFIQRYFIPLRIFVKDSALEVERLGVFWTPATIMLDSAAGPLPD
jgi:hypothetical protein